MVKRAENRRLRSLRLRALKNRIAGKTRRQVEEDFWTRHSTKLANTAFDSEMGREYVRLRIAEWFR